MKENEEEVIQKYITKLQKKIALPETPQEKKVKYLGNLRKLPITIKILKCTGIGKTVNDIKKQEGDLGKTAQDLVRLWKSKFSQQKDDKGKGPNEGVKKEKQGQKADKQDLELNNERRKGNSTSSLTKSKEHWKDVSLNLLGDPIPKKKKKKDKSVKETLPVQKEKKHVIEIRRDPGMPSLPEIELPQIQTTYRPLHYSHFDAEADQSQRKKAAISENDLELSLVSRKSRTQVFSGRRSCYGGVVPSLYQQCMKIMIENIDALEDTGGVPFEILEPMLAKASPAQLVRLEEFNPYFTEDTGELWKVHCQREFKGSEPDDMESWREFYLRKCAERVEKLKNIQSKITQSQAKKEPIRQAKLAYVAGPPKPSAQIRRKQLRYGTGDGGDVQSPSPKKIKRELEDRHKNEAEHTIPFTKIPKRDRCSVEQPRRNPKPEIFNKKPSSRPMMKAALKMMKNQRSRSAKQIIRK